MTEEEKENDANKLLSCFVFYQHQQSQKNHEPLPARDHQPVSFSISSFHQGDSQVSWFMHILLQFKPHNSCFPSSIEEICCFSFFGYTNIKNVFFKANSHLKIIGQHALHSTSITRIRFPLNLEEICEDEFNGVEINLVFPIFQAKNNYMQDLLCCKH